jgi:hypothetical protein
MSDLTVEITGFVAGDNLEIRRAVTDLPSPIVTAWITLKAFPGLGEIVIQKEIDETDEPGVGQIEEPGDETTPGDIRFDFLPADTTLMGAARYVYDIQIILDDDTVYTLEKGRIQLTAGITAVTIEETP